MVLEEDAAGAREEGAHGHVDRATHFGRVAVEEAGVAEEARVLVQQHRAPHRTLALDLLRYIPIVGL
jgi:hypothetical protein